MRRRFGKDARRRHREQEAEGPAVDRQALPASQLHGGDRAVHGEPVLEVHHLVVDQDGDQRQRGAGEGGVSGGLCRGCSCWELLRLTAGEGHPDVQEISFTCCASSAREHAGDREAFRVGHLDLRGIDELLAVGVEHDPHHGASRLGGIGLDDDSLAVVREHHGGSDRVDGQRVHEGLQDLLVVLLPVLLREVPDRRVPVQGSRPERPAGQHGVIGADDTDDERVVGDLRRAESAGVAGAVDAFVVLQGRQGDILRGGEPLEDPVAEHRVRRHRLPLFGAQRLRGAAQLRGELQHPDLVQQAGLAELDEPVGRRLQVVPDCQREDRGVDRVGDHVAVTLGARRRETAGGNRGFRGRSGSPS